MTHDGGSGDPPDDAGRAARLEALQSCAREALLALLAERFLEDLRKACPGQVFPWMETVEGRVTFTRLWPGFVEEYLEALKLLHAQVSTPPPPSQGH